MLFSSELYDERITKPISECTVIKINDKVSELSCNVRVVMPKKYIKLIEKIEFDINK